VLNSLEPAELEQFERILAGSPDLRSEVTELSDTAVELGLALPPIEPGELMRARILAAVAATPQRSGVGLEDRGQEDVVVGLERRPVSHRAGRRRSRSIRRWAPRATATAAGIAAAIGLVFVVAQVSAPADHPSTGPVAITAASDAQIAHVPVDGGGTLTVEWSHRLGRSVVSADGLPRLAADRTYELWYVDGKAARPAGLFDGTGQVELTGRMAEGDTIGMTIEPKGGSAVPSMVPIASVGT